MQTSVFTNKMGGKESKPGYRILEVADNSPASKADLIPFLDFIVKLNETPLMESQIPFHELLRNNVDCPVTLTIYNLLTDQERDVLITPQENWGGTGVLGVTMRYENAV